MTFAIVAGALSDAAAAPFNWLIFILTFQQSRSQLSVCESVCLSVHKKLL